MISRLLFESVWLLLVTLVASQFVLIAIWSRSHSPMSARAVWVGFAAIPLLLLSIFVVTPRERIIGLCRDLAAMVDRGDVGAIGQHLAGDFEVEGIGRDEFLVHVERILTQCHIDNARLHRFDVTFREDTEAVAGFTAVCRVRSADAFHDRLISRWRLTFRRYGRAWRVTGIETVPTPLSPIRDVRDFLL